MNTFPHAATRVFSRSRGELARLLFAERQGGSFAVLRAMYRFGNGHPRGDWINRLLMQSPAVKAARNRRKIAQAMLAAALRAMPAGQPVLVLAIGGGDGCFEAEVIARADRQDIYYCGVDQDERAVAENRQVLRRHGLEQRGCTLTGHISGKDDVEAVLRTVGERFQVSFAGVSVCVCQGIAEYLDMHSTTNETLTGMLRAIHDCSHAGGQLIISQTDYHDRVKYLEKGLSWYMRLRDRDELAAVVKRSGWKLSVCEREPMELITMCSASKAVRGEVERGGEANIEHCAVVEAN
jgi:hypothetical protein